MLSELICGLLSLAIDGRALTDGPVMVSSRIEVDGTWGKVASSRKARKMGSKGIALIKNCEIVGDGHEFD